MARALVIEEEAGTCSGFVPPHNGYYGGDFRRVDAVPVLAPILAPRFVRCTDDTMVGAPAVGAAHGVVHIEDRTAPRAA